MRRIGMFAMRAALACFACVVVLLALTAAMSTARMEVLASEHTYHLPDSPIANVAFVVALVAVLCVVARGPRLARLRTWLVSDKGFCVARAVLLALVFASACVWLLALHPLPVADQWSVLRVARASLAGDWSDVGRGGYLSAYPFQVGIVLVLRCFVAVFGDHAELAFQLSNAVALVAFYVSLGDLLQRFGAGRLQQLALLASGLAFFPLTQYVAFVYGTLWGLALITLAMRFELEFLRAPRVRYAVLCAIALFCSLTFKENYKICAIAMVLVALLELVLSRKVAIVGLLAAIVVALVAQSVAPRAYVERASGMRVAEGVSSWSYLAMGLQEVYADCGWYSDYNLATYRAAGDDAQEQARVAKEEFARRAQELAAHPQAALRFFVRKIASQWNNPTFQGAWIAQVSDPARPVEGLGARLVGRTATDVSYAYLNLVQFALLVGACAWVVLQRWGDERARPALLLALAFVGGFLCHVFWEAKAQYTLPYFVLLLPLATMGYARVVRAVCALRARPHEWREVLRRGVAARRPAVVCVAVACVLFAVCCACGAAAYLTLDAAGYQWYVASNPVANLLA